MLQQQIREARGTRTRTEFGAEIGVSELTVWKWETGRTRPRSEHVPALVREGVDVDAFETETELAAI